MRSLPLIALTLSLACNLDSTGVIPPEATRVDPEPREAHAIDTTATGFVTTPPRYPIHVHWTTCEYETYAVSCVGGEPTNEKYRAKVIAGVNRWAEIIAPSPHGAPPVEQGAAFCHGHVVCAWAVEAGDTLVPGLHLFVDIARGGPTYATVRTDNTPEGLARWGFIAIGIPEHYYTADPEHQAVLEGLAYQSTLHEIGHVLGVGTAPRWHEHLASDGNSMALPAAIAIFDRDGGHVWTGPKVPTVGFDGGRAIHWHCLVPQDVMTGSGWYYVPDENGEHIRATMDGRKVQKVRREPRFVTEVTAASLRRGYVYDASTIRPAEHGWPLPDADRESCQEQMGGG